VVKRAYFMSVVAGVFCVEIRVINRRETRFNRNVWLEWDYWRL